MSLRELARLTAEKQAQELADLKARWLQSAQISCTVANAFGGKMDIFDFLPPGLFEDAGSRSSNEMKMEITADTLHLLRPLYDGKKKGK